MAEASERFGGVGPADRLASAMLAAPAASTISAPAMMMRVVDARRRMFTMPSFDLHPQCRPHPLRAA